jgi:hypothetical protein
VSWNGTGADAGTRFLFVTMLWEDKSGDRGFTRMSADERLKTDKGKS